MANTRGVDDEVERRLSEIEGAAGELLPASTRAAAGKVLRRMIVADRTRASQQRSADAAAGRLESWLLADPTRSIASLPTSTVPRVALVETTFEGGRRETGSRRTLLALASCLPAGK